MYRLSLEKASSFAVEVAHSQGAGLQDLNNLIDGAGNLTTEHVIVVSDLSPLVSTLCNQYREMGQITKPKAQPSLS